MAEIYEPRVVAFCCHYCAYSAADLAGSMRLEYAPNVRIIKLMCTGKVDTLHLLKAFEDTDREVQTTMAKDRVKEGLLFLKGTGMKFTYLSPEELKRWQDAEKPARDWYLAECAKVGERDIGLEIIKAVDKYPFKEPFTKQVYDSVLK